MDDSIDREPMWFRVSLKVAYMFCWAAVGFFAGVFFSANEDYEMADRNSGIQVILSAGLFALVGLLVPWHVVRRIAGRVKENEDSIPTPVRILVLILFVAMMFAYKWMLNQASEFWAGHF